MKEKITIPIFEKFIVSNKKNTVCITDENVFLFHKQKFKGIQTIIIGAGEENKTLTTIEEIVVKLKDIKADRTYTVYGIGGGMVLDVAAFVANIYMRGLDFVAVPTTILAMVDASIGGKNGINFLKQKNFLGTVKQPQKIIIDTIFLQTLDHKEWQNGFAEIIKHAAINNKSLFKELEQNDIIFYKKNNSALKNLLKKNIDIKTRIVAKDVFENGDRKLLNFGHTLGHAIETIYQLPHGFAVSIGMVYACKLSEKYFNFNETTQVITVLKKYELPTEFPYDKLKTFEVLSMDKKKQQNAVSFILLEKIGKAKIEKISLKDLKFSL